MTHLQCLLVDDDPSKRERVRAAIELEVGTDNVAVRIASSAHEAGVLLRQQVYDLLIIDLNLPIRPNEAPLRDGGIRLLRQVARGTGELNVPSFIVGLTAFEELVVDSARTFQELGWALVTYSAESDHWEQVLANKCRHAMTCKARNEDRTKPGEADVCVITARVDVELQAILDWPTKFESVAITGDTRRYSRCVIAGHRPIHVLACACPEQGNAASAALAASLFERFRPKVCILAGICAGIDARIGDLVVGTQVLHYESGKWTEGEGGEAVFKPEPHYLPAGVAVMDALRRFELDNQSQFMGQLAQWRGNKPETTPSVCHGPIASGAAVIENRQIVNELTFRDRKIAGLEMESYGCYLAAHCARSPKPEVVMIKGVSDLASPPKTDDFQPYAAHLSAQFIWQFLSAESKVVNGLLQ